ncbi:nodulation protein NfeD [Xylanibacillus composti]|uniref:Nodulation protein NfeD n=1 Tax=Xylanibacillus composti TaxID=1572762 RepID=A0A8J4H3S5_9BACL|nr:NfeD family protein [Xylanibacillus composti]MDT9724432.1 nodulation protein NfeD [Xylanibacillus composti]GIQ68028.1 nodulation protein NfeD [Xylanibacillus composti]
MRLFSRRWAIWMMAVTIVLAALNCIPLSASADEQVPSNELIYVIPVKHGIENGLAHFIERAVGEAEANNAAYIVLDIDTLGGRLDSALGIGETIRGANVPTVAYVNGKAISAGSYIALNADQIVMGPGSTIGAAAIVDGNGNRVEDSKLISAWSGEMRAAAEMNGRNGEYAVKMVDDSRVVEVTELGITYGAGELITFTAQEAEAAGYAEGIAGTLKDVQEFLGAGHMQIIQVERSVAERVATFLTNPIVITILILLGLIGIGTELFTPGFGIPGIVGIAAFGLYFFGHIVAGFAGSEHVLLFVGGAVLLLLEIFVPSFGILGILGALSLLSGVVLAAYSTEQALMSLGIAVLIAIVVFALLGKYLGKRGVWNRFVLQDQMTRDIGYRSALDRTHLLDQTGIALTSLRPSGTALIGEERVDVVTGGEFISAQTEIIVVKIEGNRIVVREK